MQVGDKRNQGKDTFTLFRIKPETWSKDVDGYSGKKTYSYRPCRRCGKLISDCGFSAAHYKMHQREKKSGEISDQHNQGLYWDQCVNSK